MTVGRNIYAFIDLVLAAEVDDIIARGNGIERNPDGIVERGSAEASAHDEDNGLISGEAQKIKTADAASGEKLAAYGRTGMDSLFPDILKCIIKGYEHPVSIFCSELVSKAGSEIRFMAEHRAFAFCSHNYGYAHKSAL